MDNLVDAKIVRDYIKGTVGDAAAPINYGNNIDVVKYLNG